MRLRCPKCGQNRCFAASQAVRGVVTVWTNAAGHFVGNTTESGHLDTSSLDADEPEGFACPACNVSAVDQEEVGKKVDVLPRGELVRLLELCGIQCYDCETDGALRESLLVNLADGTISEASLP